VTHVPWDRTGIQHTATRETVCGGLRLTTESRTFFDVRTEGGTASERAPSRRDAPAGLPSSTARRRWWNDRSACESREEQGAGHCPLGGANKGQGEPEGGGET
jgi:hypothetical protein